MSRAAVEAKKAKASLVAPGNMLDAAREAHEARESRQLAESRTGILSIASSHLGIDTSDLEPFVLPAHAEHYPESQRVCIEIDGVILNYGHHDNGSPRLLIYEGPCPACGMPVLVVVRNLADIGLAAVHPERMHTRCRRA